MLGFGFSIPKVALTPTKGDGVRGRRIILLAAGQSNMVGYDLATNVDPALDAPIAGVTQYLGPLGPEILPAAVASGDATTGWSTAGCTVASVGGRLVATVTSGSNPRVYRTVSGLEAGATYCVEAVDAIGPTGASMALRIDSPQTQRYVSGTGIARTERMYFTAGSTTATLYMIAATTQPAAGLTFGAGSFSVRKVLAHTASPETRPARCPLDWPDALVGAGSPVGGLAAPGVSPALHAAKRLMERGAASVLIIPCAVGSTYLVGGAAHWGPSGARYLDAVAKLTVAVAADPGARVVGLWIQGEADGAAGVPQATYEAALTAMLAGFRAVSPGMRWIVGGMVPEYLAANAPVAAIDAAHQVVASADPLTDYVAGISGYPRTGDANLHYLSQGYRLLGAAMGAAIR